MPRGGLMLRDRQRRAGSNGLHRQQTERPCSGRNPEVYASSATDADELCQSDDNLKDRAALRVSRGGLEVGNDVRETCAEGQMSMSREGTEIDPAYSRWHEIKESSLLADAWREKAEEITIQTTGCGAKGTPSTNCKRACYPPQWDHFRDRRREPIDRSKITIPRSLIGRVGADAAMERLKVPPTITTCSQTSCTGETPREVARPSARTDTRSSTNRRVSAYLSIKAEQIRSRRDHERWLSRVASGLHTPTQDPLSLVGDCLESNIRPEGNTQRQPKTCPPPGGWQDSNHEKLDNLNILEPHESEADERAAAERREFLSVAHLEGLVDSARRLLEDEALREFRARTMRYLFGHDYDEYEENDSDRGVGETIEAYARRCLAESKRVT
ncbi:unnamed protein product [Ectocarpus sp. 4 AP-2014]